MNQCKAKSSQTGLRCRKAAIAGAKVCRTHGGAARQVQEAAKLRILGMVNPALAQLRKLIDKADSDHVKLSAIKDVLDRAGLDPRQKVDHRFVDADDRDRPVTLADIDRIIAEADAADGGEK